jgi:hypothetical protein
MMNPPEFKREAPLQAYCMEYAEECGVKAYAWKKSNLIGAPDVILVFPGGLTVYVEFKHPNGRGVLSENQKERIRELRGQRAPVYVCHTFAHFAKIVAHHLEGRPRAGD